MDPNQNSTPNSEEQNQPIVINPQPADVVQPESTPVPEAPKVNDVMAPVAPAPVTDSSDVAQPASPAMPESDVPATEVAAEAEPSQSADTTSDVLAAPVQPELPKKRKSKVKLLVIIIIAVLVLLGASAGAYFGVILPNKPENKLMSAFMHMADQTQTTTTGKIDYQGKGDGASAVAIDYTLLTNADTKQFSLTGDVGVSGVSVPFDARYVEENMYMKVSGLESIGKLLGGVGGEETTQQLGETFSSVNDKWFVIDRSMMQGSEESKCSLAVDLKLNDDDMDKIYQAYKKHPIFAIKGQSAADVSGVSTTKFELDPASSDVAKSFAKEIESISIIDNLKKCTQAANDKSLDDATDDLAQNQENAQIFVYVTADNQMKKLEVVTEDDAYKATVSAEFAFGEVKIEKPADAKPVQELLGLLMGGISLDQGMTDGSESGVLDAISL